MLPLFFSVYNKEAEYFIISCWYYILILLALGVGHSEDQRQLFPALDKEFNAKLQPNDPHKEVSKTWISYLTNFVTSG